MYHLEFLENHLKDFTASDFCLILTTFGLDNLQTKLPTNHNHSPEKNIECRQDTSTKKTTGSKAPVSKVTMVSGC